MMQIKEYVKDFIWKNQELIENNKWDEIYRHLENEFNFNFIGEFTTTILNAGVNPLEYMKYVPKGFLYGATIYLVDIPDHITTIEDYAFYGCHELKNVKLPENLLTIGMDAFMSCNSLTSVTIPEGVVLVGNGAFRGCDNLTGVSIAYGLNSIVDDMFALCYNLKDIKIAESVTSIGDNAFFSCKSLSNISIPASVTNIGSHAFEGCRLTNITIPNSVTYIGNYLFYRCYTLHTILFNGTKKQWDSIEKGAGWNYGSKLKRIECVDGNITLAVNEGFKKNGFSWEKRKGLIYVFSDGKCVGKFSSKKDAIDAGYADVLELRESNELKEGL